MRVGVVGSRGLTVPDLERYLPPDTTEIISGGAQGVDTSAARYARAHGLKLTEILPDYAQYGRRAPLLRNLEIIVRSELVLAFWDGKSRGTAFVIDRCRQRGTPVKLCINKATDQAGGFVCEMAFVYEGGFAGFDYTSSAA